MSSGDVFLPQGVWFLRRPDLIWLHVISDGILALAYFAIPLIMIYFMRRVPTRIGFKGAIALFALFIVLCGIGHVLDIVTVWYPVYYLQGWVRAATAAVSIATVLAVVPLVPRLLAMKAPEELDQIDHRLRAEIMAREAAEGDLRRSLIDCHRAVSEQEQFAYITSHDLQAPLRNIAGFSQLLTRRYASKLDGDALEFLNFIEQGVRQMQTLIQDLLQLSRVGRTEAKAEPRPLDEPLRSALAALKAEIAARDAHIEFGPMPDAPAVQSLMVQLFMNLVGNAIKFQNPGNRPELRISAEREPGAIHLRIEDNGIGIPADQLENVFAVFRRLHGPDQFEGTGIGLAICRKIVQHHHGEIWAESAEGAGTTIHVRLPTELPIASDPALAPGFKGTAAPA